MSRSNRCNTASTPFSPNSLFTSFTAFHSDQRQVDYNVRTRSLLFDLFRHQGKGGNRLHHDFDDDLGHSPGRRDPYIDIKATHEVFNGFEQFDESVVTGFDVLDRLIQLCVTKTHTWENKKGSYG